MLNLTKLESQWRNVKCEIPSEKDPSGFENATFKALFKLLDMDEFRELTSDVSEDSDLSEKEETKKVTNILDEVLLDVKDVEVREGDDALHLVKKNIWTMKALMKAYMDMYNGMEEKNLKK